MCPYFVAGQRIFDHQPKAFLDHVSCLRMIVSMGPCFFTIEDDVTPPIVVISGNTYLAIFANEDDSEGGCGVCC